MKSRCAYDTKDRSKLFIYVLSCRLMSVPGSTRQSFREEHAPALWQDIWK